MSTAAFLGERLKRNEVKDGMGDGAPTYPGAVAPERIRNMDVGAIRLRVYEWGDPAREPLVMCHGMADHARAFDVIAPLLAQQHRVIAFDARGHGDSTWAGAYPAWDDVGDLCAVLNAVARPCHLVGHSKGGGIATDAASVAPGLVRTLVNIDGFGMPKEASPPPEAAPVVLGMFLDRQRARRDHKPVENLELLVERRHKANARLSLPWLRYFVHHGTRRVGEAVTWKYDRAVGDSCAPWNSDWLARAWSNIGVPVLAVRGTEPDFFGPASDALLDERLSGVRHAQRVRVADAGHYVYMEQPERTAQVILDFIAGV